MRKVDLYIETVENSGNYSKIEMFNDEEITVSSSIQNVNDISKIFTDYSQSFTVPSSVVNNAIFEHFYNNDVDTLLDHNLRRNAYIEIDYMPFRTGKIQLEKAMIKNNQNENYSITFYGETLSLKDKFGDVKLKDLDYTSITTTYTGSQVQSRITDTTDYDVRFPLITSQRQWTYGDSTSTDISIPGGRIDYTELFPALKISKIFEAIETKFSLDFQGLFLTDTRFTNCFLYCKNKELFETWTPNVLLNYTSLYPVQYGLNYSGTVSATDYFNTTTETLSYSFTNNLTYGQRSHEVDFSIQVITATNCTFIVDVYNFGVLEQTFQFANVSSGTSLSTLVINELDVVGLNRQLTFKVRANKDSVYRCFVEYVQSSINYDLLFSIKASSATTTASVGSIDLSSFMPDMTVYDFLSGIFKNFNLTCYAKSKTIFQIEPLEDWYNKGRIIDITKHTTTEEISVSRVPLYKTIKFEHEQSQSFMNREFFDLFGKEYGDLYNTYNYDGADYQIKVPFENLLHTEFDGTMTQVGFCIVYLNKSKTSKPNFSTNSSGKVLNAASNGLVKNKLGLIPLLNMLRAIKNCKDLRLIKFPFLSLGAIPFLTIHLSNLLGGGIFDLYE